MRDLLHFAAESDTIWKENADTAGDVLLLPPGTPHGGNRYDCLLDRYTVLLGRRAMDVFGPAGEQLRGVFPTDGCRLIRLPPERFSEVTALQYKNSRSHNAHTIPLNEGQNIL